MAAPRERTSSWEEVPPEPVSAQELRELRDLRDRLDTGKLRAEIIGRVVIVNPMPVVWHEKVCQWLLFSFLETCRASGWWGDTAGEIELPPTGDLIEPDFMILSDASKVPDLESLRPLSQVLLVAEVISPSSIQMDREVKPRACALAGIPLYLLVDRFTKPATVSLCSEPGMGGYAKITTVAAGTKLELPAPFNLTLDTSTVPLPA